jgi:hypothetical protein
MIYKYVLLKLPVRVLICVDMLLMLLSLDCCGFVLWPHTTDG